MLDTKNSQKWPLAKRSEHPSGQGSFLLSGDVPDARVGAPLSARKQRKTATNGLPNKYILAQQGGICQWFAWKRHLFLWYLQLPAAEFGKTAHWNPAPGVVHYSQQEGKPVTSFKHLMRDEYDRYWKSDWVQGTCVGLTGSKRKRKYRVGSEEPIPNEVSPTTLRNWKRSDPAGQ